MSKSRAAAWSSSIPASAIKQAPEPLQEPGDGAAPSESFTISPVNRNDSPARIAPSETAIGPPSRAALGPCCTNRPWPARCPPTGFSLPAPPAAPAGRPGSDRFRGHPHRHIAASNEGLIVGRPVRHPILRLIPGMNLRLHPRSVAPAEGPEKCGPRRPTRSGYSCNNAA